MASLSGQVAAAVVASLEANGYFGVALSYAPTLALAEGIEYAIFVTPVSYAHSLDHNRVSKQVSVSVVLLARVASTDEFETYNETMEKIADLFYKKQISGLAQASCHRYEINPLGSDLRFRETGQYLAQIQLDFLLL